MNEDFIAIAGELAFEKNRLTKGLRRLEPLLPKNHKVDNDLDLLYHSLERVSSLVKTIIHNAGRARLVDCSQFLEDSKKVIESYSEKNEKTIGIECRGAESRVDQITLDRFKPVFLEMLKTFIEYSIESPKERQARKKSANPRIQIEVRQDEHSNKVILYCDGNGIVPPLASEQGLKLARIGAKASFEGKPGQWSVWVIELPLGIGSQKCQVIRHKNYSFALPVWSFTKFTGSAESLKAKPIWTLNEDLEQVPYTGATPPIHECLKISAGTESKIFYFESLTEIEDFFVKPLEDYLNLKGRFLGVVLQDGDQNELSLVINPAFLVYGPQVKKAKKPLEKSYG